MEYYKENKQTYSAVFSFRPFSAHRQYYTQYECRFIFLRRYDKKRRLKYRRRFLSRVCADVCGSYVYVLF